MKQIIFAFVMTFLLAFACETEKIEPNDGTLNSIENGMTVILDSQGAYHFVYHKEPRLEDGIYLYQTHEKKIWVEAGEYTQTINTVFYNQFEVINGIIYNMELKSR